MKKTIKILSFAVIFGLFSCSKNLSDPMDKNVGLTNDEFRKAIMKSRQKKDKVAGEMAAIPQLSSLVLDPPSPVMNKDILNNKKKISFSVTDDVPLRDVLIELGRVAKIDVDLDSGISGGIVISANNRPLGEIVERICKLGNLRYKYENHVLHFERDLPFTKNYFVDYLSEGNNLWGEVQSNLSAIMNNVGGEGSESSITISKTAGIMSIFANDAQHKEAQKYLDAVEKLASAQVIIEAKVVEVELSDEFKTGINWDWASSSGKGSTLTSSNGFPLDTSALSLVMNGDLGLSVDALEKFGTSRTLSSPRIHAINNQKAVLNFAKKLVYFKIDSTQTNNVSNGATSNVATVTSEKIEEEVGVELSIVPSINVDTNEVTLNVKPRITAQFGSDIIDPASPTDSDGKEIEDLVNKVPQIKTRELETTAKIQSGNVLVIGGLMEENTTNVDTGVPFLQRIPFLGYLFKSTSKESSVTETVIFIKATIVNSGSQVDKVDRDIQRKFDPSKRKFF